ncbi:DinB family protein [Asanoa sp. WMMD1127]|uniref:DinB family protein n=1 Tax=Asanoa sp. WMMD1127 TaxID=3016107 RepID=UPI002415D36F|nr:DinB family protein [Asanoa sp. WMMD1127]MDG4825078.1 DinB family protein [Asanoa sp. WMMD1127]
MTAQRPLDSEERCSTAPERAVPEAFLDAYREELTDALRGLSEEEARRRLVPSLTTVLGLGSWRVGPTETMAEVVADYEDVCERSRRLAASIDLDHTVPHPRLGRVSLRYVYVHMIRELARHCGHADILREQLATGPDA